MARKRLGHGTKFKLGATYLGLLRSITPPSQTREAVDVTVLDDALEDFLDSDPPNQGELKVVLGWEPGDTNSELLDTLFKAASVSAREGSFTIEYPFATPSVKDVFSGRITTLAPAQIQSKELITREVTIRLTSSVVRTVTA
jgi:hypothetical protein